MPAPKLSPVDRVSTVITGELKNSDSAVMHKMVAEEVFPFLQGIGATARRTACT